MASRPPFLIIVRSRYAALTSRERLLLGIGAATLLLFILYLLLRGGGEDEPVELTTTLPPAAASPASQPLPVIPVVTAPSQPLAAPADTSALSAIILRGVSGGGPNGGAAIFALPNGGQRVVRVGREVMPGVLLQGVGLEHAIVSTGSGGMRLSLGKTGAVPVAVAATPPPPAPSASPGGQAPPASAQQAMMFRTALAPRRSGGRVTGFTIRPGANIPILARAGMQPGDVLVAVNGQAFESEEKVLELASEIAGSYTADFEFERGGQRMRRSIEINKRPQ